MNSAKARGPSCLVIGGGPGGLATAALLARRFPRARIDLIERNRREYSHGYGITLRDHALRLLDLHELLPLRALTGRRVLRGGEPLLHLPPPSVDTLIVPLARDALIQALSRRCLEHGVDLRWGVDAKNLDASDMTSYDLVIAADGAGSALRTRYATELGVSLEPGRNHFAWFATTTPYPEMTILIEDNPVPAIAWAYQYSDTLSSFIVETSERGHEQLRAHEHDAHGMTERLTACFDPIMQLRGDCLPWRRFIKVRCERLHVDNLVLIGDAAHTTHFSQGFGSMFALDDAVALVEAIAGSHSLRAAQEVYSATQLPKIRQFQDVADASQRWSESLVTALEQGDSPQVHALIAARWEGNTIGPAPLAPVECHVPA